MLVPIADPGVIFYPQATALDGDHASGATALVLQDIGKMEEYGKLAIDGLTDTFDYTLADLAASQVTISPPLTEDVDGDTTVTALDAQGKPLGPLMANLVLHYGEKPIECEIDGTIRHLFTEGTDMVGQRVEIDSAFRVIRLPNQKPYIDPSMFITPTEGLDKSSPLANGTFELPDPLGLSPFANWKLSWGSAGTGWTEVIGGEQIAGDRSCGVTLPTDASWRIVHTGGDPFPVRPGDKISLRASVTADRDITMQAGGAEPQVAKLMLMTSDGTTDPADIFVGTHTIWQGAAATTSLAEGESLTLTGEATVPDGHYQMRVGLRSNHPTDGLGDVTVIWDEVGRDSTGGVYDTSPDGEKILSALTVTDLADLPEGTTVAGQALIDLIDARIAAALGTTPSTDSATFEATSSKSYDGSGNTWSTETMFQGNSSKRGQRKSAATYDATAISTWLAGRTATAAYLRLRVDYAPAAADTLRIGQHTSSTLPSTYGAITGKSEGVQSANPSHSGSVVEIPLDAAFVAAINAGTFRGIIFGPGLTTADKYVYQIDGVGQANPPQLRIEV